MITKLLSKLKDKARRELFVAGQIKTGIPFQIRALRDKYGWTQAELGERMGMTQTNISRLESPGYGKLNITTLQRLAAAFDVALVVRFVPFSRLINWVDNLSPEDMAPQSFTEELESLERVSAATNATLHTHTVPAYRIIVGGTALTTSHNMPRFYGGSIKVIDSIDLNVPPQIRIIRPDEQEEEALEKVVEEFAGTPIPLWPVIDYSSRVIG